MNLVQHFVTKAVSFDLETYLIGPGILSPPPVCGSIAWWNGEKCEGRLLTKEQAMEVLIELLESDKIIVGANLAFDMLVGAVYWARKGRDIMPLIFMAYDEGRVYDILVAEALHAIAEGTLGRHPRTGMQLKNGRYSQENVVEIVLGRSDAKANDEYRLRYGELDSIPMAQWPREATQYPVDDAVNALEVAIGQLSPRPGQTAPRNRNLHDLPNQVYTAFALHVGAAWGFQVDPKAVHELEERVRGARDVEIHKFIAAGIVSEDDKKSRAPLARLVAKAFGASQPCPVCAGSGKTPSPKTNKPINCDTCSATGYNLDLPGMPLNEPSDARLKKNIQIGSLKADRDTLHESGDDFLMSYAEFCEEDKVLTTYTPWLRRGIDANTGATVPLNLRPNVLVETGRCSYSLEHQLPRNLGIRECIVARPGYVLCSSDYGGLELVTHAQSCLWMVGWSKMAEALNAKMKVHDALGGKIAGISYEEMLKRKAEKQIKDYRQAAKPANFGFPGGMAELKLVLQQRKQGPDTVGPNGQHYKGLRFCLLVGGAQTCGAKKITEYKGRPCLPVCPECVAIAKDIRLKWLEQWPENEVYFGMIEEILDGDTRPQFGGNGEVIQHVSRRIRGGLDFCSAANGYFQGLASEGAKLAARRFSKESFCDKNSPIYGSRLIYLYHDELFIEMPESVAHEAAARTREIMVESMRVYTPDVFVDAEPALMRRWYKAADPVYDGNGRLIPWEPQAKG